MFRRLAGDLVGAGLPTLVVRGFAGDTEKHGLGFRLSRESTASSCVATLKKILFFLCNYSLGRGVGDTAKSARLKWKNFFFFL